MNNMRIKNKSYVRRHKDYGSVGVVLKQSYLFNTNYSIGVDVVSYVSAIIIDDIVEDIIRGEKIC